MFQHHPADVPISDSSLLIGLAPETINVFSDEHFFVFFPVLFFVLADMEKADVGTKSGKASFCHENGWKVCFVLPCFTWFNEEACSCLSAM